MACSDSPFRAVEAAMAVASKAMNGTFRLRTSKVAPPVVDVFGWCTWDAFYHAVTPAGVEAGVHSLTDGGIPPKFVIIDDGWQSVAPDPQFKKRVDHISDHPPTKPDFIDKPHVTEVVEFGRETRGGGALAWAGGALASGLEYAYWNALHSVAYNSLTWNVAKFLVDWVFSPVIRGAFSTMSCFNHRVSAIHANVKFQDQAGSSGSDSPSRRVKGRGTKRKSPTADGGVVGRRGRVRARHLPDQGAGGSERVLLARAVRILGRVAPVREGRASISAQGGAPEAHAGLALRRAVAGVGSHLGGWRRDGGPG